MTAQRFFKIVSHFFHPIVLPMAATLFVYIMDPNALDRNNQLKIFSLVMVTTYIIPLLLLFVLKKNRNIQSYQLGAIQERKSPVVVMVVIFYMLAHLLGSIQEVALLGVLFMGCSISLTLCYIAIAMKVKASIHMIGTASACSFILIYSVQYQTNLLIAFAVSVAVAGLVGQARLHLKAHNLKEIIWGTAFGIFGPVLAYGNVLLQP